MLKIWLKVELKIGLKVELIIMIRKLVGKIRFLLFMTILMP